MRLTCGHLGRVLDFRENVVTRRFSRAASCAGIHILQGFAISSCARQASASSASPRQGDRPQAADRFRSTQNTDAILEMKLYKWRLEIQGFATSCGKASATKEIEAILKDSAGCGR